MITSPPTLLPLCEEQKTVTPAKLSCKLQTGFVKSVTFKSLAFQGTSPVKKRCFFFLSRFPVSLYGNTLDNSNCALKIRQISLRFFFPKDHFQRLFTISHIAVSTHYMLNKEGPVTSLINSCTTFGVFKRCSESTQGLL